jgi:hypothetical protein
MSGGGRIARMLGDGIFVRQFPALIRKTDQPLARNTGAAAVFSKPAPFFPQELLAG